MTTFTEAQQALIDRYRDINTDHEWWDSIYSNFEERMEAIGIRVVRMYFRGFWSQGDGACFDGWVYDWELFLKSLGITNDVLVEFACNYWSFSVKHSGHYYHENCVSFFIDIPNPDGEDDEWFIERYSPYAVDDFRSVAWLAVLRGFDFFSMEEAFRDAFKDHMRQLYKDLEEEYDYRTSDEAVWESIVANELDDELEETCE
jgi:hypothetical protein